LKDGLIDFKEFAMGLLILGGNSAEKNLEDEALDFIFRWVFYEYRTAVSPRSLEKYILRLHDVNCDGTVEREEAEKVRNSDSLYNPAS